jgi:multimeric flavodoxin WrbA
MTEENRVSIIALNGSPHRAGNTATLMSWVVEGCEAAGASVSWLHVVDQEIQYCEGCFGCLRTGACVLQGDDFHDVLERLRTADGMIVGSPVYEGQATAQLRTLMDRMTLLNLYTDLFEKSSTVGVATSGVAPTRGVAKELAVFFGHKVGVIGAKTASISAGYQPLAAVHSRRLPERARKLGWRLAQSIQRRGTSPPQSLKRLWISVLRRLFIKPLVLGNREQFAGVIQIWQEKGIL